MKNSTRLTRNVIAGLTMSALPLSACSGETARSAEIAVYECRGVGTTPLTDTSTWSELGSVAGIEDPSVASAILSHMNEGPPVAGNIASTLAGCERKPSEISSAYLERLEVLRAQNDSLEENLRRSDEEVRSDALRETFPYATLAIAKVVTLIGPEGPENRDGVIVTMVTN